MVILVDANLLLYAEDSQAVRHAGARDWWDARLSGDDPVSLCWTVLTAFVRIGTNPRVYARPLSVEEAGGEDLTPESPSRPRRGCR